MDDDPMPTDDARGQLDALVPTVDVDVAWTEMAARFERDDHRRRTTRAVGLVGAAAVLVAAIGIGLGAGRSSDQRLDVGPADAPTSEPQPADPSTTVAPADPSTPTTTVEPDVVTITCSDGVGTVTPSVAVAGPAGLLVEQTEGLGALTIRSVSEPGRARGVGRNTPGWVRPPGATAFDGIIPGHYDVICGSDATPFNATTDPSIGTFEVIDPLGFYTPESPSTPLTCATPKTEQHRFDDLTPAAFLDWRFGPGAVPVAGYREGASSSFRTTDASGTFSALADGVWDARLSTCPGAHPMPAGDGLDPDATIRTEAQALAWLNDRFATDQPSSALIALPSDAVVTGRAAKLVRQDEGGLEAQVVSNPPGYAGWLVAVDYVASDGVPRVAVYQFSPTDDPGSLARLGGDPAPPGGDWAAWFATLPDHAP